MSGKEKKSLTGLPNHKRKKYGLIYGLGIFTNFPVYIYYKKQQQQQQL